MCYALYRSFLSHSQEERRQNMDGIKGRGKYFKAPSREIAMNTAFFLSLVLKSATTQLAAFPHSNRWWWFWCTHPRTSSLGARNCPTLTRAQYFRPYRKANVGEFPSLAFLWAIKCWSPPKEKRRSRRYNNHLLEPPLSSLSLLSCCLIHLHPSH